MVGRGNTRIISWLWECLEFGCNAIGTKPTARYLALKRGKRHGVNVHGQKDINLGFIRIENRK